LKELGWKPGLELAIEAIEAGITLRPTDGFKPATIAEVYGCLSYTGATRSLEHMAEGIRKGASGRRRE
jgi:hypothetical protein